MTPSGRRKSPTRPSTRPPGTRSMRGMDVRANVGGGRVVLVGVTTGALLSVALGVYGRVHTPTGGAIALFGFDTMIQMKVWLALATGVLAVSYTHLTLPTNREV